MDFGFWKSRSRPASRPTKIPNPKSKMKNRSRDVRYALAALLGVALLALLATPPGRSRAATPPTITWGRAGIVGVVNPLRNLDVNAPIWSANVRANTDSTSNGQHEPSLAVSPANPDVVVVANK